METTDAEALLLTAPIKGTFALRQRGVTKGTRGVLLGDNDIKALVKPATASTGGEASVRRERAAWVVAKMAGWVDLVAPTVIRTWTTGALKGTTTSVQLVWSNVRGEGVWQPGFSAEDVWRAACFDVTVDHRDRRHRNYLVTYGQDGMRVRLIDHSYAFGYPSHWDAPASDFVDRVRGRTLPSNIPVLRPLVNILKGAPQSELPDLLGDTEFDRMLERIRTMTLAQQAIA